MDPCQIYAAREKGTAEDCESCEKEKPMGRSWARIALAAWFLSVLNLGSDSVLTLATAQEAAIKKEKPAALKPGAEKPPALKLGVEKPGPVKQGFEKPGA